MDENQENDIYNGDNTVVTIATECYLWGVFLLISSMRKNGMNEPVLVGVRHFKPWQRMVLEQLGGVRLFTLDDVTYSLPCYKALMMLQVKTPYVTWVDADGFFTGNCSDRLKPAENDQIHIRMRGPEEEPMVFRGFAASDEDVSSIPDTILNAWRDDISGLQNPAITRSCSSCVVSVHESSRDFLRKWHYQTMSVLPSGEVSVSDPVLKYYHMLSESVLNSVLAFWPQAPKVTASYALDKDPSACYVHFSAHPKPWHGWPKKSFAHFGEYIAVVEWARSKGYRMPGKIPFSLKRRNRAFCALWQIPMSLLGRVRRKLQG